MKGPQSRALAKVWKPQHLALDAFHPNKNSTQLPELGVVQGVSVPYSDWLTPALGSRDIAQDFGVSVKEILEQHRG